MIDYTFEDLVRKYVNFRHGVVNDGWNLTYCEVCGDGSRTKGPRGGWLFSDGGNSGQYHCFNESCEGNFSLNREHPYSKNIRHVLDSFGIPSMEYDALIFKKNTTAPKLRPIKIGIHHTIIEIPDHFVPIDKLDSDIASEIKKYIRDEYALSSKDYSFYYATGKTKMTGLKDRAECQRMRKRLIIPYFKNGKVIFYQGRDLTGLSKLKYLSAELPKKNILFNIDQLWRATTDPLYVTEGAFDAIHLSGVSTGGNELTADQKVLLTNSPRRKILVPDFNGDSNKLMEDFIAAGWEVSIPDYRSRFKDVSEAVINYGKLYVAYDIVKNIKTAMEASMALGMLNKHNSI